MFCPDGKSDDFWKRTALVFLEIPGIRANSDGYTNFTVLDVNEGQESREVEAYVSTYAKGGHQVGSFSTSNSALDEAFKLCPEG